VVVAIQIWSRYWLRKSLETIISSAGTPAIGSSTLPGKRLEVIRASTIATIRSFFSGYIALHLSEHLCNLGRDAPHILFRSHARDAREAFVVAGIAHGRIPVARARPPLSRMFLDVQLPTVR